LKGEASGLSEGPLSKSFLRGESSFPRETPNLSIVVPYFNEIHRVGLTLPEIVGLANPSVEVVLVDDGSTDGTVKVLREAAQNTDNVHFQQCSFPTMFISKVLPVTAGKGQQFVLESR
jgi:glycosyltransferase involved in cell wall biosynthesis